MERRFNLVTIVLGGLLLIHFSSFSQKSSNTNYNSISKGNWNSKSIWDIGKSPGSIIAYGDTVFINHDVSFPKDLTIYGVIIISSSGSLKSHGTKNITIKDGAMIEMYGDLECEDLVIEEGGTISAFASIVVNGDFKNEGSVIIEVNNSYTGSLSVENNINKNSKIEFKRLIKANGWHYISAPVDNVRTNYFNGASVYSYIEPSHTWKLLDNGDTLTRMKGYDVLFRNSHMKLVFRGVPDDNAHSIDLTYTQNIGDGFNMAGNPYTTSIDWDATRGWTKTNVDDAIYVWDDSLQSISSYVNGVSINGGSNIIPPTMGFFVRCNNYNGGKLGVTKDVQVTGSVIYRSEKELSLIKLGVSNTSYKDETVINFNRNANEGFDLSYDAEKIFSFNEAVPQIYTRIDSKKAMAINSIQIPQQYKRIPILLKTNTAGNYNLLIELLDIDPQINVLLEDVVTNTMVDISGKPYPFYSEVVNNQERFILHLTPSNTILENNINVTGIESAEPDDINIFCKDAAVYINFNETVKNGTINIFDLNGKNIYSNTITNSKTAQIDLDTYSNNHLYLVRTNYDGKVKSQMLFLK